MDNVWLESFLLRRFLSRSIGNEPYNLFILLVLLFENLFINTFADIKPKLL